MDRIKSGIQESYGISPESVCVNASHTHSAPPLTVEETVLPEHLDDEYSQRVLDAAVGVVGDAIERPDGTTDTPEILSEQNPVVFVLG